MHDIGAALSGAISYCLDTNTGQPTTLKLLWRFRVPYRDGWGTQRAISGSPCEMPPL